MSLLLFKQAKKQLANLPLHSASLSTLRYTLDNNETLDVQQRQHYEKNGFVVIRNLIAADKLSRLRARFQKICAEKLRIPGMTVMKDITIAKSEFLDGERAITKIQDFCHDDELFEYCRLPELVRHVSAFTGPNIMAMHTMLINKPPGFLFDLLA